MAAALGPGRPFSVAGAPTDWDINAAPTPTEQFPTALDDSTRAIRIDFCTVLWVRRAN